MGETLDMLSTASLGEVTVANDALQVVFNRRYRQPIAKVWAAIGYLSGQQVIRSDAPASVVKVSIQIRKMAGVTPSMRVVDADGVIYRIDSVLPDMVHRDRINLACEVISG